MHDLLARFYHAAQRALHLALLPGVGATLLTLAAALAGRLGLSGRGRLVALGAVLAGWLVLSGPLLRDWPLPPVARPAGAAALLIGAALLTRARVLPKPRQRKGVRPAVVRAAPRWRLPALCLVLAWWLRGAPIGGNAILGGIPLFLGLWAGVSAMGRLARNDRGWGSAAAAIALAGSLAVSGAAMHWARLALVVAGASLVLVGVPEAPAALVACLVVVAGAAIVASDRGRFVPADAACLMPLLAIVLAPRLLPRRPAVGAALAALLSVGLVWAARARLAGL